MEPASIVRINSSRARVSWTAMMSARRIARWMAIEIENGPPAKRAALRSPAGIDAATGVPRIRVHAKARISIEPDTARQTIRIAIIASSFARKPTVASASPEIKIGGGATFLRFICLPEREGEPENLILNPLPEREGELEIGTSMKNGCWRWYVTYTK